MNGYGNSVFLRTAWEVSSGVPPVNTVAPAITGTAKEGETVTCSTGTWTGTPTINFGYQWKRNGSNIGSATNSTYMLVTADVSQSITCQVTGTNGSGSASATSNTITPISAVDPDAQAFITAAAITNPTQQAAINTLVVDLKGYGIWTKSKALYPFVGGTASQHKFNLKDPRDLDAAFRLVFSGGWTHSNTGATPNGTNAYADTKLNPSSILTNGNNHISYYSRTNQAASNTAEMGVLSNNGFSGPALGARRTSDLFQYHNGNTTTLVVTTSSNTDSTGHFIGNILSSTNRKTYKNGTLSGTNTNNVSNVVSNTLFGTGIYLGARNISDVYQGVFGYSTKQCAFASIGDGLNDTEAANFYTAVQAFQTTLGRQV